MGGETVLFYLAVGRLGKDKNGDFAEGKHTIIASATAPSCAADEKDYKTHVRQIMDQGAAKLIPEKRLRLGVDATGCELHIWAEKLKDTLLVYFAVTDSTDFRKLHSAQTLLEDFKTNFGNKNTANDIEKAKEKGNVHKASQNLLSKLISQYGENKLGQVSNKVKAVKGIMEDNIEKAMSNVESLEDIETKAEGLETQAEVFNKQAVKVKKHFRCQNMKLNAAIAVGVIILIIILFGGIFGGKKKDDPS